MHCLAKIIKAFSSAAVILHFLAIVHDGCSKGNNGVSITLTWILGLVFVRLVWLHCTYPLLASPWKHCSSSMTLAWRESCAVALGWMRKGIASVSELPWRLLGPVLATVASTFRTCPVTRALQGWVWTDPPHPPSPPQKKKLQWVSSNRTHTVFVPQGHFWQLGFCCFCTSYVYLTLF